MVPACLLAFFSTFLLSFGSVAGPRAEQSDQGYAAEMTEKARKLRLWEDPYWTRLLRYRHTLFRTWRSETKRSEFFLSKEGRTNPQAELEAEISAFFQPLAQDKEIQHPQCRFPVRYAWLKEKLSFDPSRLHEVPCEKFERWRSAIDAKAISIVFASGFLNNPATLYGHTLLKMRKSTGTDAPDILDYSINFAADARDAHGVMFALKGVFGGYPGRFSSIPYYLKIQEYNNIESRDLWEYRLSFNPAETDRILRHAWELGSAEFPYFFFTKNCSYQLLPLLDVGNPVYALKDALCGWVLPVDTVSAAVRMTYSTAKGIYRPSLWAQVSWRRANLAAHEAELAKGCARDKPGTLGKIGRLPKERQAAVLETANVYLDFLTHAGKIEPQDADIRRRDIQVARAKLGPMNPWPPQIPRPVAPNEGHKTLRLGAGFGLQKDSSFNEVAIRGALQDLLDDPGGYLPDSRLEMLNLRVRINNRDAKAYLREADLFHVMALNPYDDWLIRPSWEVGTGIQQAEELRPPPADALYYELHAAGGMSFTSGLLKREVFYLLAQADSGFGGVFDAGYRLGGGVKGGLTAELASRWRVQVEAKALGYGLGDRRTSNSLSVEQIFQISRDVALRLELLRHGDHKEARVALHGYFAPW